MSAAAQLVHEAEAAGIRLISAPDGLRVVGPPTLPRADAAPLLDRLRRHRADVLAILQRRRQPPADPCPVPHPGHTGSYYRQDGIGAWRCGRCTPDPRPTRWQGVTLAILGDRRIVLRAPSADLPAVGEWVRLPGGAVADLLAYTPDGAEALLRLFSPPGRPQLDPPRFVWVDGSRLVGEPEWCGCGRRT